MYFIVLKKLVLQIDKFYTVVKIAFELTFQTVDFRRRTTVVKTSVQKLFSLRCKIYLLVKLFL